MVVRVVLTRPAPRQVALQQTLQNAGLDVLGLPALEVVPLVIQGNLPSPHEFDATIFVSRSAWQIYWEALTAQNLLWQWPSHCRIAAVGASTAKAIEFDLNRPDPGNAPRFEVLRPADDATQDSESLWLRLRDELPTAAKVLLVRGQDGRDWLAQRLQAHGFVIQIHENYRREPAQWAGPAVEKLVQWKASGMLGTWLITSSQGLSAIQAQWLTHGLGAIRPEGAVVIHPRLLAPVQAWLPAAAPVIVTQPDDNSVARAFLEQI